MPGSNYAFMTAYLKGEESKIVTGEHMDRMMKTPAIQDALAAIAGTDIGDYLEEVPVKTFDELDGFLWDYLAACVARIEAFRLLPKDMLRIMRAYLIKYDVSNIKTSLSRILTGKKAKLIPLGTIYNSGLLDELSSAEGIDSIIKVLEKCKLKDYGTILGEYSPEQGIKSRLSVEAKLYAKYYSSLLGATKKMNDGPILARAFGSLIDLTDLQIVSRAIIGNTGLEAAESMIASGHIISLEVVKDMLTLKLADLSDKLSNILYRGVADEISSSYSKTQSITATDEIIDKYKFTMVKDILSPRVLSNSVIVWYLIIKELEIRNIRLILKAMFDNLSLEEIKNHLVVLS